MYCVECPYCHGVDRHVVQSDYWDDIERTIEECMRRASPESLGRLGYVQEGFPPWFYQERAA